MFEKALGDQGHPVEVIHAHLGQAVPECLDGHLGLVVLGGTMNARDDERCPWLPAVRALIARVVRAGSPFLGICLGHQLAAVALGGRVGANPAGPTIGVLPIRRTDEGGKDPLLGELDDTARAVHWNGDVVIALPADAIALACQVDGTVQAARYGARAWGLQFHPEVTPEVFDGWREPAASGLDPRAQAHADDVGAQVQAAQQELADTWAAFARRFAELSAPDRHR